MKVLTVQEYDAAEHCALLTMPNRIIEQSGSVVFAKSGYPTYIYDDRAAARYVDVMHENRFENDVDGFLGGLTGEELDLVLQVNRTVAEFTKERYGRSLFATGSLIRAINVLRHIRYLFPNSKPTVLEIGPGSGYLGALLLLRGHRYIATDVTQAMYVYQNHLWNYIATGRVHEMATEEADIGDLLEKEGPFAVHIPWWKYLTLFTLPDLFGVNVVTANHTLCEMPEFGRAYTIRLAAKLLPQSSPEGIFIFENWGRDAVHPVHVYLQFRQAGFELKHDDNRVTVLTLGTGNRELSQIEKWRARFQTRVQRLLRRRPSVPGSFVRAGGSLERLIAEGRRVTDANVRHSSADVISGLKQTLGLSSLITPDEQFAKFVGYEI